MGAPPKYRLSQAQLRRLTVDQRPAFDAAGRTILVPNPNRTPYRFADGNQGAPGGFTIYVGPQGARYEVRTRIKPAKDKPAKAVRITLGALRDLSLATAYELAGQDRTTARRLKIDPRAINQSEHAAQEARGTTVGDALRDYITHLERRQTDGTAKANGVAGARDALARLERPEVGLAGEAVADITDARLRTAWMALRQSAMIRSNRIAAPLRERLAQYDRKDAQAWQSLSVHAEHAQAVADIARGFTAPAVPLDQRIVLAHTHADREALNAAIRPILREQGVLTGDEYAVQQPGGALALAVGDRVTFDKNHAFRVERTDKGARVSADARTWAAVDQDGKALDQVRVVNGGGATVEAIRAEKDTHRITVRLHSDDKKVDGTRLSWLVQNDGATKTPGFGHAYATTVHRAQGQTMRDVFHLANSAASNSAVLVAFTRIKTNGVGTYHLAGDADSIDALKGYAIGRLDVQRNAIDLQREAGAQVEALHGPEVAYAPALMKRRGTATSYGIGV